MSHLVQDLRFAARGLAKQPSYALAAILTLALAIGANTAIFSFVDSVLLNPPPFKNPDRVVVVWSANPQIAQAVGVEDLPAAIGVFYDWQRESRSFESLALLQSDRMTMTGQGEPEQLGVVRVAGDFFSTLGTPALAGRVLTSEDDAPGNPQAAVISHAFWKRRFAGDPQAVGRSVTLNDMPMTIVGVMPPRFAFPRGGSEMHAGLGFAVEPDAWVPLALPLDQRQDRGSRFSVVIGRLKAGVGLAEASQELGALCGRYAQQYPDSDQGWGVKLVPVREQISGGLRPALLMLWAAVGLVLLIACANVANLLLARAAARDKEIALRTAIGAGQKRLLAQLLTETGLLAVLGGGLGIALAWGLLRACRALVPPGTAGGASFALDGRALAFTAGLCFLAVVLAGLVPAFQASRPNLAGALREGTRAGSGSLASQRLRSTLVVAEIALAVLLLIGAGLLLRSFLRVLANDPGFQTRNLLTFRLDLPPATYPPAARVEFFQRVVDQLKSQAGIATAAAVSELPLSGSEQLASLHFEGRPLPKPGEMWSVGVHSITPGYFDAMGIKLVAGRDLNSGDGAGAALAAVIDEEMARAYWPGEDPLGKRFRIGRAAPDKPWITVVGIAKSIRHSDLHSPPGPRMYQTMAQVPMSLNPYFAYFVARTNGDPRTMIAGARAAVHAVSADQPLTKLRPMTLVVSESIAKRRFSLLLLGLFALLALVLAVVGIYGVTAYSVAQRTRELGLRMALGALPEEVLGLVLRQAGKLAAIGVGLGALAAFFLTRLLSSLLYGVGASDPLTFAGVGLCLGLVAVAAAYLPGRRATRVSPVVAIQGE